MAYGTPVVYDGLATYETTFTHTNGQQFKLSSWGTVGTASERDDLFLDLVDLLNTYPDLVAESGLKTYDTTEQIDPT